jgi:arginyl-tRNA--protein-N-Asp/Glu arginylyltransferase
MNRVLKECAIDDDCAYLDNRQQRTHYKVIENCDIHQCSNLIKRGWRRFGSMFFRPICGDCTSCESIKIDVENYTYSKSSRRIIKKASHLRTVIQHPTLSSEHLRIFRMYHDHMKHKKGWEAQQVSPQNYYMSFVQGHSDFGYEVLYFDEDRLVAVDLIDILDDGISSIYFYYDPEYQHLSLGKYSLLYQIEYAKQHSLDWIYLGYYVEECPSLSYKSQYKPYTTLQGRPEEHQPFIWS